MANSKQLVPHKEPRQRRSKVTYEAILEATAQLLIESGYAVTTTNHIAERAGISIGSLYQYFPNKEAIAVELLQRHIVSGLSYMESQIAQSIINDRDPSQIVKHAIEAACDHHSDNPILHKVLEEEVPHPAHIREAIRNNESHYANALAGWIERQCPQQVTNPTIAARMVFFMIKAMTHWYIIYQQDEIKRDVFIDEMTAIVMRYLFPSTVKESASHGSY